MEGRNWLYCKELKSMTYHQPFEEGHRAWNQYLDNLLTLQSKYNLPEDSKEVLTFLAKYGQFATQDLHLVLQVRNALVREGYQPRLLPCSEITEDDWQKVGGKA